MPAVARPEVACVACGGTGWILEADGGIGSARRCPCRAGEEVPRLLEAARIPPRYQGCRLAGFKVSHPNPRYAERLLEARSVAEQYLDSFLVLEERRFCESGLLFIGPPGVGKTHLAAALLQELIGRYRVRGLFVDFTSLIHQIQSTFDPSSQESKQQVLDPVMRAELLVLDELGAQKPTAWVQDILYLVLNGRYSRRLPTLFTTNYRLEPEPVRGLDRSGTAFEPASLATRISPSVLSRLYEMARPVTLDVDDFRREVKARPLPLR